MSQLIEEIILKVRVDDSSANTNINQFTQNTRNADQSTSAFTKSMKILGGVIAAIGFKRLVSEAFEVSLVYDKINQSLKTVTGSQSAANKEFNFLSKTADDLGVSLPALAQGYTRLYASLQGAGISAEVTRELAVATAELSTAMGLTAPESEGISRALSQIASKGKLSTEELLQLAERGVDAFGLSARAIGVTTEELSKMLAKGEIISSDFLPKFGAQMRKEFGEAAANASNSAQANVNRLSNEWDKALTGMGNTTQKFIPILTSLVKGFNTVRDEVGLTVDGLDIWRKELLGIIDTSGEADTAAIEAGRAKRKAAEESKKLVAMLEKENKELEKSEKRQKALSNLNELGKGFIFSGNIDTIRDRLQLTKQEVEALRPSIQAALNQGIELGVLENNLRDFVNAFKSELNTIEIIPQEPFKGPFDSLIDKAMELKNALNMKDILKLNQDEFDKIGSKALDAALKSGLTTDQLKKQIDLLRESGAFDKDQKSIAPDLRLQTTALEVGSSAATQFLQESAIDVERNKLLSDIERNTKKNKSVTIVTK